MKRTLFIIKIVFILLVLALAIFPVILSSHPWPEVSRNYLYDNALTDTGAVNTVSSIYLGYRAMDTLGETLVLLVSITGTMGILINLGRESEEEEAGSFSLAPEKRPTNAQRTHLLEVVSSKLGPVVLLFGFYVMLYGHISPGGGFQGGVIVASAIVFLALGTETQSKLTNTTVLGRIESLSFLVLILAATSGVFFESGFFSNPSKSGSSLSANFIILLNIVIGLKVGTSIAVMCIAMMGGRRGH
ncbi:MAG: MnhB domain-containing protein [Sphaerochaeta sp.]